MAIARDPNPGGLAVAAPRPVVAEIAHRLPPTELVNFATMFAQSGMFTDAREVAQAFVKIQAGQEMGLEPFQSMSGIHVIKGKPVVGANLLASLLDRHPAYDYRVAWDRDQSGAETACTVTIVRGGVERGSASFTMADAETAGLASKDTWRAYRSDMLFARAMSRAVRRYAGAVTAGAPVYVDGEVEDLEPISVVELANTTTGALTAGVQSPPPDRQRIGQESKDAIAAAGADLTEHERRQAIARVVPPGPAGTTQIYEDQVAAVVAALKAATDRAAEQARAAVAAADPTRDDAAQAALALESVEVES